VAANEPQGPARRRRKSASPADRPADPSKRKTLKKLAALGALAVVDAGALASCGRRPTTGAHARDRLILLGIDGLDPGITARMMAEGKLPNMLRLRAMGGFRTLASTIPPQSPVAWATFITGQDPGRHEIYDFLHRHPDTYELAWSGTRTAPPKYTLPCGRWRLPLSSSQVDLLRKGRAFWEILEEHGVPCEIHRAPSNFPPRDTGARQLAGLGTPDMRGSLGEHSYFAESPQGDGGETQGERVRVVEGRVRARLKGPRNSLQAGTPDTAVDFDVWVDRRHLLGKLSIQGQEIVLRQGEWSGWVPIRFTMVPHVKSVGGICRFYMKEVAPSFKLYVTPVHFDPMDPPLPIDAPPGFARELAERHGRFHTAGLPEDTGALMSGVLDDGEYLHQAGLVLDETRRIFHTRLQEFQRGLLFSYFGTTDRNQHVFWRTMDPLHPYYDEGLARDYGGVVEECYRMADELVGEALAVCDSRTDLIVLSDHGFAPFYRKLNLNGWLADRGYLAMRNPQDGANITREADWGRSAAYGIGLNGLYLNLKGRERDGVVTPEERGSVARRLAADLKAVRDPDTGEPVIANVYLSEEAYSTVNPDTAPDLIVGYARGYRCSALSAVGVVTYPPVEDNANKWSGDHCIDRQAVPGILLATKPIRAESPALADVTASVLAAFGVAVPGEMQGKPIW